MTFIIDLYPNVQTWGWRPSFILAAKPLPRSGGGAPRNIVSYHMLFWHWTAPYRADVLTTAPHARLFSAPQDRLYTRLATRRNIMHDFLILFLIIQGTSLIDPNSLIHSQPPQAMQPTPPRLSPAAPEPATAVRPSSSAGTPTTSSSGQSEKLRCDVCNYETTIGRNLRIHMTSEKQ